MNWFQRLVARAMKFAGVPLRDPALVSMLGNQPTAAGVDVDERTALNISAVWQAVSIISQNVAAMPLLPFVEDSRGRTPATDHWSYPLLTVAPSDEMTPFTFYESLTAHALTWGNGYAYIDRDSPDEPARGFTPLLPNQTRPERNDDGDIQYRFTAVYPGEQDQIYEPWEVLHIPGMGFDGIMGYPVVQVARESMGLSAAVERYGAAFFGRGSAPGGVLQLPEGLELSAKAKAQLRASFESFHRGPDNAHRVAVLEDGITYTSLGLPLETAQFLATRAFQIVEVARWFNIPPHLLRDLSHATFSNIEHQGIDFLVYTLRPWLLRWQQEIRRKLFTPGERMAMGVEHDAHNLLLTDVTARFNAYKTGRDGGWLTLNDILRREKMNPLPPELGDSRLIPANMRAVGADGHDVFATDTESDPENTAMNGNQVQSMLAVVQACAAGSVAPDTAVAMLRIAFPAVAGEQIEQLVKPIREGQVSVPNDD